MIRTLQAMYRAGSLEDALSVLLAFPGIGILYVIVFVLS